MNGVILDFVSPSTVLSTFKIVLDAFNRFSSDNHKKAFRSFTHFKSDQSHFVKFFEKNNA